VENVTGEPLSVVLRRDLIDPAGLDRVWVQTDERPTPPLTVAVDTPDQPLVVPNGPFLPSRARASSAEGGGGMAADAPSIALWGYQLYGGHVIDPALVDQMTDGKVYNAEATIFDQYGLGTMRAYIDGHWVFGHLGDIEVYTSMLMVWPETGTAVAALVPQPVGWTGDTRPSWGSRCVHSWTHTRRSDRYPTPGTVGRRYEVAAPVAANGSL